MRYFVTSVYDTAAAAFSKPTCHVTKLVAEREFRYACQHIDGLPVDDCELYFIGWFDDSTGIFEPGEHVLIVRGSDCKKGVENG